MKHGSCPKCQSNDVYKGNRWVLKAGSGYVHLSAMAGRVADLFCNTYVCRACGYLEMYVAEESQKDLVLLPQDKNWQKAI